MKPKVYVVTEGSYSGYRIQGVFGTPELAQTYVNSGGGDDIEEYELDAEAGKSLQRIFSASLSLSSGALRVTSSDSLGDRKKVCSPAYSSARLLDMKYIWAESVESQGHANKVAVEYRQALIRENPGWGIRLPEAVEEA